MNRYTVMLAAFVLAVAACTAYGPTTKTTAQATASRAATRPTSGPVALFKHVRVDLKTQRIFIDAKVCTTKGQLEFLLCKKGTKDYESILSTEALPREIHACLLLLGLTPGIPAEWVSVEPGKTRFLPPRGAELKITLQWRDKKGKAHQADASSWLTNISGRKTPPPKKWVFVGSMVLPGNRYLADLEGEIISVANFASSVIDVPFESTDKNAMLEFEAKTKAIPPKATEVQVILQPLKGALKAPYARAVLEIDRFGQLMIEGKPIAPAKLHHWGRDFINKHEHGRVILRAAGRALVFDVERARIELRVGGVRDFQVQRLTPTGAILPRTPAQAAEALQWWPKRFANAKELIRDPGDDAADTLKQISQRLEELDAQKAMWGEYAEHLRVALKKYRASTQPAGGHKKRKGAGGAEN